MARDSGERVKVRLWGVNCPEKRNPRAHEATRFTRNHVLDRRITIEEKRIDPYGRTVAIVWLKKGVSLNHELIWFGWGEWSKKYAPKEERFKKAQEKARLANRGIW